MTRVLGVCAALCLCALAPSARGQDAKPPTLPAPAETARRHKADPRALELVRRADRTTYRPTDAGLKTLRCDARYQMTNGIIHRMAYVLEAPGRSTLAVQTTESGDKDGWDASEAAQYKQVLDDLFDGPRLEKQLEPYELEIRDEEAGPVVVARKLPAEDAPGDSYLELRFLPEGPLAEEGPGADSVKKGISARTRLTYEARGDLFVRKKGVFDGYGPGTETWKYQEVDGILLPSKYSAFLAGLGGTMSIADVDVNKPLTGPAALPPPAAPPPQEECDALDVDALAAKLRPPFVGPSPNPVTAIRVVRALAKRGDDAKRAIPTLVMLIGIDKWTEAPEDRRPADYAEVPPAAAKLLARLAPESIEPLVVALRSPISDQRKWAAKALGDVGPDAAVAATDALLVAVEDDTWFVGIQASDALRRIGCPAEKAIPRILRKADVWWMGEAYADEAIAFAEAGPHGDSKLVDAFVAGDVVIQREDDGRTRGVEQIFRKRGSTLAAMLASAGKTAPAARRVQIARALACSGPTGADVLASWIVGGDSASRLAALRAVAWTGRDCAPLAPTIAPLLASTEADVADAAESALSRIGASAEPALTAFFATRPADGEDAARERAQRLLERLRGK